MSKKDKDDKWFEFILDLIEEIIEAIIEPLITNKVEFASPALFNQLLPIGVAQTEEQKALQQQKNEPIKNWQKKQKEETVRKSGWNKLKSKQQ